MFKPILAVAVLLGSAVYSPAQFRVEGNLGHGLRLAAVFGDFPGRCEEPRYRRFGHWENVRDEVWVPGCWRDECIPARFGWVRDHCGRRRWAMIEPECHRSIWVPGHTECRSREVWAWR